MSQAPPQPKLDEKQRERIERDMMTAYYNRDADELRRLIRRLLQEQK